MKLVHLATAFFLAVAGLGTAQAQSNDDFLTIQLKDGPVVIQLMPDIAPKHVAQIKELAKKGEYDNVAFHRVMENGFDGSRAGTGGSSMPDLPAEFSSVPFERGTIGMARSQDPNSANSQFFIMFADGGFLNGQYTVVGKVVAGMDAVDKIKRGEGGNGEVSNPDRMVKVTVGRN